jgi:hypothetical protein
VMLRGITCPVPGLVEVPELERMELYQPNEDTHLECASGPSGSLRSIKRWTPALNCRVDRDEHRDPAQLSPTT